MLIIHGTVHTMDGPAIDNGFVAIREGKIWKVGPMDCLLYTSPSPRD